MFSRMMGIMRMVLVVVALLRLDAEALDVVKLRRVAARNNLTCILVFGDSSVDPGNNNRLPTTAKGNFRPYGKNFFGGRPTGRLTNGRLPTDIIAEAFGVTRLIPAFLDPNLKKEDLLHGVSFASASSGYDDLTANLAKVLPLSKQVEYLMHYKIHLRRLVGEKIAVETIRNAIFIVSAGTNDFLANYFLEPTRSKQFTVDGYADYLIDHVSNLTKAIHRLGGTRFVVVGIPPLGCIPIVRTLTGQTDCANHYNQVASLFNSKLKDRLATLKKLLGVRTAYIDAYKTLINATKRPMTYGFTVTSRGCCGSGTVEVGETCKGQSTCMDPTKYIYWDAVHPTERMYEFIANDAVRPIIKEIFI
ncbi:GDSL esterase/lipase At5g45950-like [Magnolia sinica]|uniref:GDSL esterase/lipase At5g45950-like n=1 Tax=Magnolia sinica TaxID=86752 RepID=UPI00265AD2EE|nr:GDSL esterase/lipase At5g45950-like [Magnolia sinica]XP_058100658.1 GDSL esterase/lipase At5g45950-like [Magnolia sinica]